MADRVPPGEVTRLIEAISRGERAPASDLLEIVYGELHAMAAAAMARERPGQTLQATALVHEAYLRLVGGAGFENPSPPQAPTPARLDQISYQLYWLDAKTLA